MIAVLITDHNTGGDRVAMSPEGMSPVEAEALVSLAVGGIAHHHIKDGGDRDDDLWPDVQRALGKLGFTFPAGIRATESLGGP